MNIILPNTYVQDLDRPLIFLLGPVRCGPLWQDDAIEYLLSQDKNILIANPRRSVKESLKPYVISGNDSIFQRQREWEWHYQDKTSMKGVLMFWLPQEANHSCEKSYALMTSNEFGHWTAMYQTNRNINLVFGTDGKFNEWKTFQYDLQRKAPDIVVQNSLEETCRQALNFIYKK